jgi:UDP-N-acetylmuramyl pentapeptide synthase
MKRLARVVITGLLALFARAVVRRYKPTVVMVTGSVGKTSTKDAVALALSSRFLVRKSEKSANSEFGVPFTILGVANPWSSVSAWLKVAVRAAALIALPNHYPNLLVLEVGADHPGDLAKITKIAKPDAVVVTRLPEIPVHVEFYGSPAAVREEEFSPAHALAPGAPLILSADDPYALELAAGTSAVLTTYGLGEAATVRLGEAGFAEEGGRVIGMRGVLSAGAKHAEVMVRGAVGKTQLLPLAAAAAAAQALGVPLAQAREALGAYEAPPGRGRLFAGVNNSTIIDDSYNASPAAVEEALANLQAMPAKRRIAVLGDMLELGRYSVMEHERTGERAAQVADMVVAVGIRAKGLAEAAQAAGVPEARVLAFDDSAAAAAALPEMIKEGDVVLVKGSQSIRVERITEALLADPADCARLPRQEQAWLKR